MALRLGCPARTLPARVPGRGAAVSLTSKAWRHFRHREAVLEAGEVYCCDPDPKGGKIICTRPAGHDGKHAAHGEDPDVPLWTWPNDKEDP
jgi:hypothetical protein